MGSRLHMWPAVVPPQIYVPQDMLICAIAHIPGSYVSDEKTYELYPAMVRGVSAVSGHIAAHRNLTLG